MNEANITSQLLAFLRQNLRGPITKLADKSIIGLPDCSVTSGGATQYLEIKLVRVGLRTRSFDFKKIVSFGGPQSRLMGALDLHGTAAWYVIFFSNSNAWWMLMEGAVQFANWCNTERSVYLPTSEADHIEAINKNLIVPQQGKSFDMILARLKSNMLGDRL